MRISFTKMQGAGNDYIYINCFEQQVVEPEKLAIKLSDRHFGVGGDGLVLICPSAVADGKMLMFNQDGSEGKMCGNAIRCVAKYLYDHEMVQKERITIETASGIKTLDLHIKDGCVDTVTVDMGAAILSPEQIPVDLPGEAILNDPLTVGDREWDITCVSMGNPHCVVFCDDVATLPLHEIGPAFEHHPVFPEQVNTEFVKVVDDRTLEMRVWERGSGETLACGTGACAAVVAATHCGHCPKGQDITVRLRGGDLVIRYTDTAVFMTGGCAFVFTGWATCGGANRESTS